MARNGSGTYTKVNTFTSGTTITASGHNQNWDDLASEMTNSVAADGQTTMTGQLKLSSGTAAAPGAVFGVDTDTGIYRAGANNLGIAVGGTEVLDLVSSACNVLATIKQNGFIVRPIGEITIFAGSSAPSGWLMCDGSSVSRTTYADLFAVIGTIYGSADGTHFNLPDCTGRVIAGKEASATRMTASGWSGTSSTLGSTGGEDAHTLTLGELPTGITVRNDTNPITVSSNVSNVVQGTTTSSNAGGGGNVQLAAGATSGAVTSSGNNIITATSNNTSGNSHKNIQPTIILNYIIFAGV